MAEGGVYINRRDDKREEKREIEEEEELCKQIEEVSLEERVRERRKCESCVREECPRPESARPELPWREWREWFEWHEPMRELYGKVAVFFCFLCKMFVCAECLPEHEFHEGMKVERKESEGTGEQRERGRNKGLGKNPKRMKMEAEAESERKKNKGKGVFAKIKKRLQKVEREESEREGKRRKFVNNLVNESEKTRKEKIFSSHRIVCDRIDVKHELDQKDCWISGLCGLENKRLVVCDCDNSCIKIFKLGSHVIQRYIRFVGSDSKPFDITEIDLKQNSTKPNLVSGSSSDISATDRADPDKQCLIAVTLPWKCQIMFIDLSKKPARTQKIIHTEKKCYSIQFYDDKIFTVCREDLDFPCSVYIYSTDGDTLNKFDTGIDHYSPVPYFAVVSGRVYLTDVGNDKVECRNVEGQFILEIEIEGSQPRGTSVDPDNNVYVCAQWHNKVYKLDADLTRYKSVLDQTTDYIEEPWALCYYRDKLFISHDWPPSLKNFVTVVRLL